jgi:mono/diheme cytochrome c family protein
MQGPHWVYEEMDTITDRPDSQLRHKYLPSIHSFSTVLDYPAFQPSIQESPMNMRIRPFWILLLPLACSPQDKTQTTAPESAAVGLTGELTYYADIKPIFETNCVNCHGAGGEGTDDEMCIGFVYVTR